MVVYLILIPIYTLMNTDMNILIAKQCFGQERMNNLFLIHETPFIFKLYLLCICNILQFKLLFLHEDNPSAKSDEPGNFEICK